MFDHFAIHVGDVERAVGRVGELHGAKPVVRGRDEFDFLLVGRPLGLQFHAIALDLFPMDQITAAVCDESVTDKLFGPRVSAVNGDARGPREITRRTPAAFDRPRHQTGHSPFGANDAPRFVRADPINFCRRTVHGDIDQCARHGVVRIAPGVAVFVHHGLDVAAVRADEFAAAIVEAQSVLRAAAIGAKIERAWVERKIASPQINRRRAGLLHAHDFAAAHAGSAMNTVVEEPIERVQHRLNVQPIRLIRRVVAGEPGKNDILHIGYAITVGVFAVKDVRRRPHKNSAVITKYSSRPWKVIDIHGAFVEAPIAVGVFQ